VWASCEDVGVQVSPAIGAVIGVNAGCPTRGGKDIKALFAHLDAILTHQSDAARQNFLVAVFDPKVGWPRRIIYRVRGTSTREEWNLKLWEAGELERKARQ
jgi:hypothetical protein